METGSTRAISEVKQEIRLREWSEQIERQQSSGLSVEQWCVENRINPKTYYYRLRRVREQCVAVQPSIVVLAPKKCHVNISRSGTHQFETRNAPIRARDALANNVTSCP